MIDRSTASRSEVLKLQLNYEDLNLCMSCLFEAHRRGIKAPEIREKVSVLLADLNILLDTMRKEANV